MEPGIKISEKLNPVATALGTDFTYASWQLASRSLYSNLL